MARVAVIGDVGGHADQLRKVLRELGAESEQLPSDLIVIQVGDLVDRGPDSIGDRHKQRGCVEVVVPPTTGAGAVVLRRL